MRVKSFYQYPQSFCPVLHTLDYIIGERLRECEAAAVKLSPKSDPVKISSLFPIGLPYFSFQPHAIAFGGPWVPWRASLVAQTVRSCLQSGRRGFDTWVGKIPWRRAWQPTALFLPGESPMVRGAWWARIHRVPKSWTWLVPWEPQGTEGNKSKCLRG